MNKLAFVVAIIVCHKICFRKQKFVVWFDSGTKRESSEFIYIPRTTDSLDLVVNDVLGVGLSIIEDDGHGLVTHAVVSFAVLSRDLRRTTQALRARPDLAQQDAAVHHLVRQSVFVGVEVVAPLVHVSAVTLVTRHSHVVREVMVEAHVSRRDEAVGGLGIGSKVASSSVGTLRVGHAVVESFLQNCVVGIDARSVEQELFVGVVFGLHKLLFQGVPSPAKKIVPIRN